MNIAFILALIETLILVDFKTCFAINKGEPAKLVADFKASFAINEQEPAKLEVNLKY